MSHTPPIPAGNQSPYPLQEPSHKAPAATSPLANVPVAKTSEPRPASVPTIVAVASGIGLAAIAGGLFYAFGGKEAPKRKKRKGRKSTQA